MFDIRYVKLKFKIEILENCTLPRNKCSLLRGGMGNMLLQDYCMLDGNCECCSFIDDCTVKSIMQPKISVELPFMADRSSTGYIIECYDRREKYIVGDIIEFSVLIIGKTILYTKKIIDAFKLLGSGGIGANRIKYNLKSIEDSQSCRIYDGTKMCNTSMNIRTVQQYIDQRKESIKDVKNIKFITHFRYKRMGKYVDEITLKDLLISMDRRLKIINAHEGKIIEGINYIGEDGIVESNLRWIDLERYSNVQKQKMKLGGVIGSMCFNKNINSYIDELIACELLHIGKNTSFGLGKYIINGYET